MGIFRQAMKQMLTACVPCSKLLTRGPKTSPGGSGRLALTFDDGPHPVHTSALLDVLLKHKLVGTFFVVGREVDRHPDLVRRMAIEGHEVGNHTWSHGEPEQTTTEEFLEEVRRTDDLIEQLTGRVPTAMRPPKGELSWRKLSGLWQMKKTVALWNIDPRDFRMRGNDEITSWCDGYRPHDGDVVLFHDNHCWAEHGVRRLYDGNVFDRFRSVGVSELAGVTTSIGRPNPCR